VTAADTARLRGREAGALLLSAPAGTVNEAEGVEGVVGPAVVDDVTWCDWLRTNAGDIWDAREPADADKAEAPLLATVRPLVAGVRGVCCG
jgi:hypothetical protein